MADYPCDGECGNVAVMSMTNFATQDTGFYCGICFGIIGATVLQEADPDRLKAMVPEPEPPAKPARGRKPKADAEPEYPLNEPVAVIVEDRPRPPGDEPPGDPASPEG